MRAALGLAALLLLAAASVYAWSEWQLHRRHDVALSPLPPPPPHVDETEARRRAILIGCFEGCHGHRGEGGDEEARGIFHATAPTLSSVLPSYSDAELARLVRFGVKRDGRTAVRMPSRTSTRSATRTWP